MDGELQYYLYGLPCKKCIINMSKYEVPYGTLATYVIFTCVCISLQTQVTQT